MNTRDYINSGILHDYCLGLLTNEEAIKVEAICHEYPQVAAELRLLRHTLEKYAGSDKVSDRIELRRKVWENIKKLWDEESP